MESLCLEPPEGLDIPLNLLHERGHRGKLALVPVAGEEMDLEVLAIEVAFEVQAVSFHRLLRLPRALLRERWAAPNIHQRGQAAHAGERLGIFRALFDRGSQAAHLGKVDPAWRHGGAKHIQVRGGESNGPAPAIAANDPAQE